MGLIWNNKEVDEKITTYTAELEQKIADLETKLTTANAKITELDQQLEQQTADFETRLQDLQTKFAEHTEAKSVKMQEQAVHTANQAKDFVAETLGKASNHLNDVDLREVSQQLQEKGNRLFDKLKTMTQPPKATEPEVKPEVEPTITPEAEVVVEQESQTEQEPTIIEAQAVVVKETVVSQGGVEKPVAEEESGK